MLDPHKVDVARRQLGTALALFLRDDDPISVHALACGGGEISDFLAQAAGAQAFSQHALAVNVDLSLAELKALRNQYWNAIKHAERYGKPRDDAILLQGFSDEQNDHALFIGWHDFSAAAGLLPVEAQAFQVWYFAAYPEKLAPEFSVVDCDAQFPGLRYMNRTDRKRLLRKAIKWARRQPDIMNDPRTDRRKLILPRL